MIDRKAALVRLAFRLPEALDPMHRAADSLTTRLQVLREIVDSAIARSVEASALPSEARMGRLQEVCDLVTLAARNATLLAVDLEPLERLAEDALAAGARKTA